MLALGPSDTVGPQSGSESPSDLCAGSRWCTCCFCFVMRRGGQRQRILLVHHGPMPVAPSHTPLNKFPFPVRTPKKKCRIVVFCG